MNNKRQASAAVFSKHCVGIPGWALTLLLLFAAAIPTVHAATEYTYDVLGRVIQVVESDGSSIQYTYDAVGNVTSITRSGGTTAVAIASFAPSSGPVGTQVTISGVGFSAVAAQNTVRFNGVVATISSATTGTLVVTVPSGATTGTISVTTPSGPATSASSFQVTTVAITSFSPMIAAVGTAVTVNGSGFDPVAANNTIEFNTTVGTVSTSSATQLQTTVPTGATSGHITVTNSLGTAVSTGDFIVPPAGIAPGDIAMYGHLTPSGAGLIYTLNTANRVGGAFFDAVQGQRVTIVLTNVSMGGTFRVYAPDGSQIATAGITNNSFLDLAPLPATGTYSI